MWVPEYYKIKDEAIIRDFIAEVGLATIVTSTNTHPIATHTAIELEYENGKKYLRGHIAKANPQSQLLHQSPEVLVIFQSSVQHYISSSWYEEPNAPTWNYMSVHLYGKLKVLSEQEVWDSVDRLVDRHEQGNKCPVSLGKLPNHIQRMLKGVTGFEIEVTKVEAAFKMSQNRNDRDYQSIIDELQSSKTPLASLMARALLELKST